MTHSSSSESALSSPAGDASATPALAAWPRASRIRRLVTVLAVLVLAVAATGVWAYDRLPQRVDSQQTLIFGQTRLAPGHENALRILVRNAQDAQPIANAAVKVSLAPKGRGRPVTLFTGSTDRNGSLAASFKPPENVPITQTLVVEARSPIGRDQVKQAVAVERSYRLLLTTDKPVYQPAQTVHIRALALSTLDMVAAAGAPIAFLVEDPKGNKVFRQTVTASDFGVAAADFTLADEVTHGSYKVTVSLGDTTSEKTVDVKPYVLPKFAVKVATERSYYLPGQHVAGSVQCDYFFGKPVAAAQVEIASSVFDVQETQVVSLRGETNADGIYRFEFDLPQYFAGRGLEKDQAEFSLQVNVVDQAEHGEQTSRVLPIAQEPIVIEAVPEAGVLKPGVENRLYILTAYPDGRPARTRLLLTLYGRQAELTTGDYGLAEYAFVPAAGQTSLAVTATDEQGQTASKSIDLQADTGAGVVLLRPDRPTYRVGDTMRLVALTSESSGSLFLDVVKDGQTLSTRSLPIENGRAEAAVDLSGDLFGALTLHAYKVLGDGSIIRDTRVVVVDAPRDLATEIRPDREVYRPGETARVSFQTRTASGPARSALGVAIVDESVFAVMEQDPGFAKLYFLLQKELLEPKYQVKGFTLPQVLTTTVDAELRATQDRAVRAAWAPLPAGAMTMAVNSRPLKIAAAQRGRQDGLARVSRLVLIALVLVPLGLWATVLLGLHATRVLGRALGRFGLTIVVLLFAAPLACSGLVFLMVLVTSIRYGQGQMILALMLAMLLAGWLAAVVALAVYAWRRRDERARIIWLLLAAWVGLGVVLAVTMTMGVTPATGLGALAFLAYLAGLLALLLFGLGLQVEGRRGPAAATVAIVLLFIPAMIAAAALPEVVRYVGLVETLGNPLVYLGPAGWLAGCAPAAPGAPGADLRNLPFMPLRRYSLGAAKSAEAPPEAGEKAPPAEEKAGAQAPRLRQFFPETLLWVPELKTDAGGFVALDVPLADSITTWRVTALASTQDGQLGFGNAALRVFQDFFVDIDLPVALTQNDEVSIPVAVYNYLPRAQQVRLEVKPEAWFALEDEATKTIVIAANDIEVVYFRIKVLQFGEQPFQVTAYGDQMSDAIVRSVAVVPDGRLFRRGQSDWLRSSTTVTTTLPALAISGTQRIEVKIYPGAVSQVVEDLERILKLPHG